MGAFPAIKGQHMTIPVQIHTSASRIGLIKGFPCKIFRDRVIFGREKVVRADFNLYPSSNAYLLGLPRIGEVLTSDFLSSGLSGDPGILETRELSGACGLVMEAASEPIRLIEVARSANPIR